MSERARPFRQGSRKFRLGFLIIRSELTNHRKPHATTASAKPSDPLPTYPEAKPHNNRCTTPHGTP